MFNLDGFIYRDFATYLPENCIYIVGLGGYASDFNQRRLARVSREMNFQTVNITDMGSTWLVVSFVFSLIEFVELLGTVHLMMHLLWPI